MAVTLALIIEMIVDQLMADNFSEGLQPKSFIDFRIEIQMAIFGKEASSSRTKPIIPKSLVVEFPAKIFQRNLLNVVS